jgi:hypothetical protein
MEMQHQHIESDAA